MAAGVEYEEEKLKAKIRAEVRLLPDGRRLYLHDGPIDVVLEGFGAEKQRRSAYGAAEERFVTILDELCDELPQLRQPASHTSRFDGGIARNMLAAVMPYAESEFITPMAAVAGAVAEELLLTMVSHANLDRAYVNDGGDIAIHLESERTFEIAMVDIPDRASLFGKLSLSADQPVRGIASSGWRGRSFSLGIADAVTVLAKTAAMADAAATVIANAVDLPEHTQIQRLPACELSPDSDLGSRLVTTSVGELTLEEVNRALQTGAARARQLVLRGLIESAALHLQGTTRVVTSKKIEESAECSANRSLAHA